MNFCHKHCKDLLIEEIKCTTCYLKQVDHPHKSSYVLRLAKQAIVVPIIGNLLCRKIDTNLFMNDDWAVFYTTIIVGSTNSYGVAIFSD